MADQSIGSLSAVASAPPGHALRGARWAAARLFSTSAFLLLARLSGAGAGFLVQLLLAKNLPAHQLGTYFTATSLAAIAGVVAAYGYPGIATRFVSRYRQRTGSALRAFVRTAQSEATILALLLAGLIAAAALTWPTAESETRLTFVIAAFTIPFVAAFRLYGSLATATRRFQLAYLPDVCLKPFFVLAFLAAIVFAQGGLTLLQVMLSLAAATIVLSLAQSFLLARHFPVALEPWRNRNAPRPAALRRVASKWRREAHAVLLVALFAQYFADLSILIAGPVLDAAAMGAFGFCLKLAYLIGFFVMMSQNMVTPDIADALNARGERRLGRKVAASAVATTAVTLFATIACLLWGESLLALFGDDFAAGAPALTVLVAAQLVRALFGPSHAVLTLLGEQRLNFFLTATAVAFLAASTVVLGLAFGLTGAACAVLLTTLFWSGISAYALHRNAGLRVDLISALSRSA